MSRRLLADIDELIEHELYCASASRTLHEAIDLALVEAASRTTRPFDDDFQAYSVECDLSADPWRGGAAQWKAASQLRSAPGRAIRNGHLEGRRRINKWTVTIQALRAWLALQSLSEPTRVNRAPRTEAAIADREKERKSGAAMSAMSLSVLLLLSTQETEKEVGDRMARPRKIARAWLDKKTDTYFIRDISVQTANQSNSVSGSGRRT